jgi:hypothetical protein
MIDDLTLVQQAGNGVPSTNLHVFDVNKAYRMRSAGSRFGGTQPNAGINPPSGVVINYFVKDAKDSVKGSIVILDKNKKVIKTFSTSAKEKENILEITKGMNQFIWNMEYPPAERIESMILWNGVPGGIVTAPGRHYAKIIVGSDSSEVVFDILPDPNYAITPADYDEQLAFLLKVKDKFNEVQQAIKDIRSLRSQLNDLTARWGTTAPKEVKQLADSTGKQLTVIEEALYQTKAKSSQDVLNYPIRLNDKLSGVFDAAASGNMAPPKQVKEVYNELAAKCDIELAGLKKLINDTLPGLNKLIHDKQLPVISIKKEG